MVITCEQEYILFASEGDSFSKFVTDFEEKHKEYREKHLIIQVSDNLSVTEQDFFVFLKYAEEHQKNGTTFVVINSRIDVDKFPETFNVVPTLQEAKDVLEMENIQRDLGF